MNQHMIGSILLIIVLIIPLSSVRADPTLPLPRIPFCGDQDTIDPPYVQNCPNFTPLTDVQVYQVQANPTVDLVFDFIFREATYNNEMGFFLVDYPSGKIGALNPGDTGYLGQAFQRAQVIFPSGSGATTPDVTKTMKNGDILVFFIVQNSTLQALLQNNPGNLPDRYPKAFFSMDVLNPDQVDHFVGYQHNTAHYSQFGFEDITGGGDIDYDDVVYNITPPLSPTMLDKDGDAIPDDWEVNGVDTDSNGSRDLNLKELGADPAVKDIFVEIDWLKVGTTGHNHKPSDQAVEMVKAAFKKHNINLHVILDEGIEETSDNKELLSFVQFTFLDGFTVEQNQKDFNQLRNQHFLDGGSKPGKASVFHYAVFGHYIGEFPAVCPKVEMVRPLGIALGSDLIVGMQLAVDKKQDTPFKEAYTLMHELGHTLGLGHGGLDENLNPDHANYKPNHLSIMNYSFGKEGLIVNGQNEILDYSAFGSDNFPELNEDGGLNELTGLNASGLVTGYKTRYYCSRTDDKGREAAMTGKVDWNCDDAFSETPVKANINKDAKGGLLTCQDVYGSLKANNEWEHLQFRHGTIGMYVSLISPPPDKIDVENVEPELPPDIVFGSPVPPIFLPLVRR